ncbi:asparagine synthase (glutamine-hydrolyzing) [Desulfobaculum sp.]
MCGIAGVVCAGGNARRLGAVRAVADALAHRGPDDEGYAMLAASGEAHAAWGEATPEAVRGGGAPFAPQGAVEAVPASLPGVFLAHRRLSIIDLTPSGHQPMCTPDRRFWLVYNGEIYNADALRAELEYAGERFFGTSDTEVLLRLLARRGRAALREVQGMFAYALVDRARWTLTLGRDALGIKPLYWAAGEPWFAFASEPQALLHLPGMRARADALQTARYLAAQATDGGERTFFSRIYRVPAGHTLRVDLPGAGGRGLRRHASRRWTPKGFGLVKMPLESAARRFGELFLRSVAAHMRSDVPVGAALSGGLDSSGVVMAMRRHAPDMDFPVFSFDAQDPALSERQWAEAAANAADVRPCFVTADGDALRRDIGRLVRLHGEPFASASIYAQYCVMRQAAQSGIRVVLDGQGADEILAGYLPFAAARLATLCRTGRFARAGGLWWRAGSLPGASRRDLALRCGKILAPPGWEAAARRALGAALLPPWVDAAWLRRHGVTLCADAAPCGPEYLRSQCALAATRTILPELLRYADRNSMACGVESRVPFLEESVVRFALSLPEELRIGPDGRGKAVLREALAGSFGAALRPVLERRDKVGFVAPDAAWLRAGTDWVTEVLRGGRLSGVVHSGRLEAALGAALGGGPWRPELWRALSLALWAKEFDVSFDAGGAA